MVKHLAENSKNIGEEAYQDAMEILLMLLPGVEEEETT